MKKSLYLAFPAIATLALPITASAAPIKVLFVTSEPTDFSLDLGVTDSRIWVADYMNIGPTGKPDPDAFVGYDAILTGSTGPFSPMTW